MTPPLAEIDPTGVLDPSTSVAAHRRARGVRAGGTGDSLAFHPLFYPRLCPPFSPP